MQFGFSGHGEPVAARWSAASTGSLSMAWKPSALSVAHFSRLLSHVPP
jgi:hypothetical protein